MQTFTCARGPTDALYNNLLDCAVGQCKSALLVVRPSLPLSSHGTKVLKTLQPFLTQKSEASEWPGTILSKGHALLLLGADKRPPDALLVCCPTG